MHSLSNYQGHFSTELEYNILQFVWKHKRSWIAKAILGKKKQSWKNQAPWLLTMLQSYSNQNNMVLAQKQKYRPMELDKKPKDKPPHTQSLIYDKGGKNKQWREKTSLKTGTGKIGQLHVKK